MTRTKNSKVNSFTFWPGSKRLQVDFIKQFLPDHFEDYYEPFVGVGYIFINLPQQSFHGKAYLSDTSQFLIDCWTLLKDRPVEFYKEVHSIYENECYSEAAFKELAEKHPDFSSKDPKEILRRAAWIIVLTQFTFKGCFRINKEGRYKFSFRGFKRIKKKKTPQSLDEWETIKPPFYHPMAYYQRISDLLQRAEVKLSDYREALTTAKKGDLVYLDPPYMGTQAGNYKTKLTTEDHLALLETFKELDRRRCYVFLSLKKEPLFLDLFRDYTIREVDSYAYTKQSLRTDLLITNYAKD